MINNENEDIMPNIHAKYKDRLFRSIFREKEELLSLYNAVNHTSYDNPEDLEVVTLENALFLSMKNDVAFIIDCTLNLYEHQSSGYANLPLRDLFYVARELENYVSKETLYSSKLIRIPTPRFVVFYNGEREKPEKEILYLSDSYQQKLEDISLELKVTVYNINYGKNQMLLDCCQKLKEYAIYISKVRKFAKRDMTTKQAVLAAMKESIEEGILVDYLTKYRGEALSMSIFEYDEEREMRLIRRDEREIGREEGIEEGIEQGETLKLIQLICKKLHKGKDISSIAEEVEEPIETVTSICEIAENYKPEYDSNKIYEQFTTITKNH